MRQELWQRQPLSACARIALLRSRSNTISTPSEAASPAKPSPPVPPASGAIKQLLPIPEGFLPDLPVGFTPLVRAREPRQAHRRRRISTSRTTLFVSRRSASRTASSRLLLANAQAFGFTTVGCSRLQGNLANSVAAQAARLRAASACILVPADLEPAKILNTLVYGATAGPHRRQLRPRQPPLHPDRRRATSGASST